MLTNRLVRLNTDQNRHMIRSGAEFSFFFTVTIRNMNWWWNRITFFSPNHANWKILFNWMGNAGINLASSFLNTKQRPWARTPSIYTYISCIIVPFLFNIIYHSNKALFLRVKNRKKNSCQATLLQTHRIIKESILT